MSNWLNSHDWRETIPSPLSQTDLDTWQAELDAIVGTEGDGTKRWRIIWGQDLETTAVWNRYRQEWMPRYPAGHTKDYVANPATGVIELKRIWHGVPRYFIEALVPRVHRNEKTERAGIDADGDVFTERRLIGPEYVMMLCVTQHDRRMKDGWRLCCLRRLHKSQTCYGRYRPPDQEDINALHEDYHLRVVSKLCRPDEKLTESDKTFYYYSWMLNHLRDANERSKTLDYGRQHILKTVVQWPGTSHDSKKNRFSIPGASS